MQRDMELVRKILFFSEKNYSANGGAVNIAIDGYDCGEIYEHCKLAYEAGLLQQPLDTSTLSGNSCMIKGLTNAGYDYLDKIRDDGTWQKTVKTIAKSGLDMSIKTVGTIATAFITAATEGVANSIFKNGGQV